MPAFLWGRCALGSQGKFSVGLGGTLVLQQTVACEVLPDGGHWN